MKTYRGMEGGALLLELCFLELFFNVLFRDGFDLYGSRAFVCAFYLKLYFVSLGEGAVAQDV